MTTSLHLTLLGSLLANSLSLLLDEGLQLVGSCLLSLLQEFDLESMTSSPQSILLSLQLRQIQLLRNSEMLLLRRTHLLLLLQVCELQCVRFHPQC